LGIEDSEIYLISYYNGETSLLWIKEGDFPRSYEFNLLSKKVMVSFESHHYSNIYQMLYKHPKVTPSLPCPLKLIRDFATSAMKCDTVKISTKITKQNYKDIKKYVLVNKLGA
jgi:hypothetical protein